MKQLSIKYDGDASLDVLEAEYNKGYKNVLIHVYCGLIENSIITSLCTTLRNRFPEAYIVGTISGGEINQGKLMPKGIVISALYFKKTEIDVLRYDGVAGREDFVGKEICDNVNYLDDVKCIELLLPGTTFNSKAIMRCLDDLAYNIKVFGGYSGGHSADLLEHFVLDENGLYDNSVFCIIYRGKDFHVDIDKTSGWQILGKPLTVTKAEGNVVYEIDHRPAVEVYERYLQIDRSSPTFLKDITEFPFMILFGGDRILRHTSKVNSDGSLLLAGCIEQNMRVMVCFGSPSLIVDKLNSRLEDIRNFEPDSILLYSCFVRKDFWGSYIDMEIEPFKRLASTSGFFSWGEVVRSENNNSVLEHNILLLSIAMREGNKTGRLKKEVHVNDSVLQGQADLMQRLTKLVVSATAELMKSYKKIESLNNKLIEINEHDKLTQLYNRGKIEDLIIHSLQNEDTTSLIMIDIDHFKQVNDKYGHGVGDKVLRKVANLMKMHCDDVYESSAGRWGGEEFFICLPNVSLEGAVEFAEELRRDIASYDFNFGENVTISLGVISSNLSTSSKEINELFIKVDEALYKAKNGGRNQVVKAV